ASAVASSTVPVACSASGEMMSIGDCDSATVRSETRVPVTMTVSRVELARVGASSVADWAKAAGVTRAASTAAARGWRIMGGFLFVCVAWKYGGPRNLNFGLTNHERECDHLLMPQRHKRPTASPDGP